MIARAALTALAGGSAIALSQVFTLHSRPVVFIAGGLVAIIGLFVFVGELERTQ